MAKRFLCYDTDNPVGVTPEGVLDTNAMGSGLDMILTCDGDIENPISVDKITIANGTYEELVSKIARGDNIVAMLAGGYVYDTYFIRTNADLTSFRYNPESGLVVLTFSYHHNGKVRFHRIVITSDGIQNVTTYGLESQVISK